jgi:hypothetical protein
MHTGHFGRVLAGQEALVSVLMPLERHVQAVKLRTLKLFPGMQHQHECLEAPGQGKSELSGPSWNRLLPIPTRNPIPIGRADL